MKKPEDIPVEMFKHCQACAITYGTLGCCTTVNNTWIYACEEGHKVFDQQKAKQDSKNKALAEIIQYMKNDTVTWRSISDDIILKILIDNSLWE